MYKVAVRMKKFEIVTIQNIERILLKIFMGSLRNLLYEEVFL